MNRIRIFISSVQGEFSSERAMLFDYLQHDALLGRMFEPFIFETTVAESKSAQTVYLDKIEKCDIYIGLFGEKYGYAGADGVSPTEKEYDLAAKLHKTRHNSRPANPLIAWPMYLYGSIEQAGTGTEMIVEKCLEHGLKMPEFQQDDTFRLIFWRKTEEENIIETTVSVPNKSGKKGTVKLTSIQANILKEVSVNQFITIPEISEKVKINIRNTKNNIFKLKSKGLLERIGSDKNGYWRVIEN